MAMQTGVDAQISHDPVVGWPAVELRQATTAVGTQQYTELAALPISHVSAPSAPEPELPCQWSNWAEPARREVDAWVDPNSSRPHGTLHLSTNPELRAGNESRLVSVDDVDFARRCGIDLTVTHAAESGGNKDSERALETLTSYAAQAPCYKGGIAVNLSADEAGPVWRHLMNLLVTGKHQRAEIVWRALRGEMDCVCQNGYHQGWDTDPYTDVQSSAARFPGALDERSKLSFSPDCRFVAEYGNTACGGDSSFTFDTYEVRVFDVTTGRTVHQAKRDEVQGMCLPYKHAGGAIQNVHWLESSATGTNLPHALEIVWTDGEVLHPTFEKSVSCFHFNPTTWHAGRSSASSMGTTASLNNRKQLSDAQRRDAADPASPARRWKGASAPEY